MVQPVRSLTLAKQEMPMLLLFAERTPISSSRESLGTPPYSRCRNRHYYQRVIFPYLSRISILENTRPVQCRGAHRVYTCAWIYGNVFYLLFVHSCVRLFIPVVQFSRARGLVLACSLTISSSSSSSSDHLHRSGPWLAPDHHRNSRAYYRAQRMKSPGKRLLRSIGRAFF